MVAQEELDCILWSSGGAVDLHGIGTGMGANAVRDRT